MLIDRSKVVRPRCAQRAQGLRSEDETGDQHSAERRRRPEGFDRVVDVGRQPLREENDGDKRGEDPQRVPGAGAVGRLLAGDAPGHVMRSVIPIVVPEVALVAHGLDRQEDPIEGHRHGHEEELLRRGESRPGARDRVVGKDEAEDGERHEEIEEGTCALEVEVLLAVTERAHEQGQSDHSIQDDHEDREHRVTRERRVVGAVEHDGGDHGHLDRGGRYGEDEGAVGFPEPLCELVGVAHDGERAPEHDSEDPREDDSADGTPVRGSREVVTEAPEDHGGGESGQDGGLAAEDADRGGKRSHSSARPLCRPSGLCHLLTSAG